MKETFQLTAINDNNYSFKLPELASPTQKHRPARTKVKRNNSKNIKDLLGTIRQESQDTISHGLKSYSDFMSTLGTLESTSTVRDTVDLLNRHVLSKKKAFNSLYSTRIGLEQEVKKLSRVLDDLLQNANTQNEFYPKLSSLKIQSEDIQSKIEQEKLYTENLKYMISNRRDLLLASVKPIREVRKDIRETDLHTFHLQKVSENHETKTRVHKTQMIALQDKLNVQREEMRESLNKELRIYEERSKAIAYYKQSQQIWHSLRKVANKENQIKELEKLEQGFARQEALKKELKMVQSELYTKENHIKEALNRTNSISLEGLARSIEKMHETKISLLKTEEEIEGKLIVQTEETAKLNNELDKILVEKQLQDTNNYRGLYNLENELMERERNIDNLTEVLQGDLECSGSIILNINRIIQKFNHAEHGVKNIKGIKEAIEYLKDKYQELIKRK